MTNINLILDSDNREFFYALDIIENMGRSILLTGKAGTGEAIF